MKVSAETDPAAVPVPGFMHPNPCLRHANAAGTCRGRKAQGASVRFIRTISMANLPEPVNCSCILSSVCRFFLWSSVKLNLGTMP